MLGRGSCACFVLDLKIIMQVSDSCDLMSGAF